MEFKDLEISDALIIELNKHGIIKPTIVQEKTIPFILDGKDVLVQSETGSGKTLAFALPTIKFIKDTNKVQVMVITPTRELAKQVAEEYEKFAKHRGIKVAIVYGGVSMDKQFVDVKKSEVVVGTPGRLLDLLRRGMLNIEKTEYLVIDEADRLLDMGFIDDINDIMSYMKSRKQTMMFSATINGRIIRIKEKYLNNPVEIFLEKFLKQGVLNQFYYNVEQRDKLPLLIHIIRSLKPEDKALVFSSTKRGTQFVSDALKANNISADSMHGDMTQTAREHVLAKFVKGDLGVLVATDVAARGIHVDDITHVINYDLPNEAETFTHRIGRTARQGRKGVAIVLLTERDYPKMHKIKAEYGARLEKAEVPKFDFKIKLPKREEHHGGGGFNRGPRKAFRGPMHSRR